MASAVDGHVLCSEKLLRRAVTASPLIGIRLWGGEPWTI